MGSYLSSYLRATWRMAASFALLLLAMHLVLFLSMPLRAVWNEVVYLDLLLGTMTLGFYGYGFASYRSRYRKIAQALDANELLLPAVEGAASAEDTRILGQCVRAEAARSEAERIRLLAELCEQREMLTSWAHEVKTPLSVCRLILAREEAEPVRQPLEEQLRRVELQIRSVMHAERLRHLDQSVLMQKLDVPGIIRAAIARCAPLMQARAMEIALEAQPVHAMGDEQCAAYILDQLLTNAAKYAPEGSKIRVFSAQRDQIAEIAVANAGVIESHRIERLFDKGFSCGEERASGMGLYYARQTAIALSGRLSVKSREGETVFTLALPQFQAYLQPASK